MLIAEWQATGTFKEPTGPPFTLTPAILTTESAFWAEGVVINHLCPCLKGVEGHGTKTCVQSEQKK